jgi:hypothetical protein
MNQMDKTLKLLFYFVIISNTVIGQKFTVEGIVTDSKSMEPVPFATIYIDGTTFSAISNESGNFKLLNFPKLPYKVIVTRLGYYKNELEINSNSDKWLIIELVPKLHELDEIVIKPTNNNGWKKYGKMFFEEFIGTSKFSKECKILNPGVLEFNFIDSTNQLYVKSDEEIIIQNNALGYKIKYLLSAFVKDYTKGFTYFEGSTLFQDLSLEESNIKFINIWKLNRQKSFNGSIQHFFKCLYDGTSTESGFRVKHYNEIGMIEYFNRIFVFRDTITFDKESALYDLINAKIPLSSDKAVVKYIKSLQPVLYNWKAVLGRNESLDFTIPFTETDKNLRILVRKHDDTSNLFIYYLEDKDIIKKNDTYLVPDSSFQIGNAFNISNSEIYKSLFFKGYLVISYMYEGEEREYLNYISSSSRKSDYQVSRISINGDLPVRFYSNGYYEPVDRLNTEKYWSYEKLDKLLPIDYINSQ